MRGMNGVGRTRPSTARAALLGLVVSLVALLLPATATATASLPAVRAAVVTGLDPAMDVCLRVAAWDPGGVLVFVDTRITAYEATRLVVTLKGMGRSACVRRVRGQSVATAYTWWSGLASTRRPDTVVLAVRGTSAQVALWRAQPPFRRLIGTPDSGVDARRRIVGWPSGARGAVAGRAILVRLGELMLNAHAWAGTKPQWLITSPATQCAAALASPKGVLGLGDSITAHDVPGMDAALKARGYVPCIYAQSSTRIYEHLARIAAGRVPLPRNVIVALGNNDIFTGSAGYPFRFRVQAVSLLRTLDGHNVVWPTIWRTRQQTYLRALQHNCAAVNNVLRDLARDRPTMAVPDWGAVIRAHPTLQFDGIHLTRTGLSMRYTMMADVLDRLTAPI
jgi:lysophospholipase L1-like esterase